MGAEPLALAAHSYGASRSGKMVYATPVVVRGDLEPAEGRTWVQTFLFWPCGDYPLGVLNEPQLVRNERLHPLDAIKEGLELPGDGRVKAWGEMRDSGEALRALAAIEAVAAAGEMPPPSREAVPR